MTHTVTFEQAKELLPQLIEEAIRGDEVVILMEGRPAARLVAIEKSCGRPTFGSAKGLIEMSKDFDQPLEEFGDYEP